MSTANSPEKRSLHRAMQRGARTAAAMVAVVSSGVFLGSDQAIPDTFEIKNASERVLTKDTVSVLTANVHRWEKHSGGTNLGKFYNMVDKRKPDIVCGQEATVDRGELRRFARLGYNVLFAATKHEFLGGRFGNFILSRYAMELNDVVDLPRTAGTSSPRNAIVAWIATPTGSRSVVNTHLSTDSQESAMQLRHLQEEMPAPDVLCGDLNQTPSQLRGQDLQNTYSKAGQVRPVNTFPEWQPDIQIDHIAAMRGYGSPAPVTIPIGSDHLAVERSVTIAGKGLFHR